MNNRLYAAVDLGSVSFHLVIMTLKNNRLVWVECKKEIVRLAAGIDPKTRRLSNDVERKALRALHVFAKTLAQFDIQDIAVVGTAAFRQLKDHRRFLSRAADTLGHPIHILTGDDEARYIYRGVSIGLPNVQRFVVDIGGGSTEFVVGKGKDILISASCDIGCITLTQQFFNSHDIDKDLFVQAELATKAALEPVAAAFATAKWNSELGTSGTVKAIRWALQNLNISQGDITSEGLAVLRTVLMTCKNQSDLAKKLRLNPRRTSVFCGGFILIDQAFKAFNLSQLKIAQGAIREGIISELMANDVHQSELLEPAILPR